MMEHARIVAVGAIVAGFASLTEPTYGGPALSKPVLHGARALHLPELADRTVENIMRSHTGSSVYEGLKSWWPKPPRLPDLWK
jgi:hypothetical protein